MKIEIRKITEEEAEEKIDINIKVWWTTYRGLIPDEIIAKLQTKTEERIERQKQTIREKNNTYGIYVDNKLVGYSSYGPARDENYKDSCEIYSCYILEEYQRLHLGRKVVIKILEDFIQEGYKTMITKCLVGNPSNKFHEAIGGQLKGVTESELMGEKFKVNVYYHDDIRKSLILNQQKEERFYLEEPSLERKEEAMEYLQEHVANGSKLYGTGGMNSCLQGLKYEDWLIKIEKRKDENYAKSINKSPGKTFFLIRSTDNKMIGMISIRYNLTKEMLEWGGHIGYGIRPTERRKGYNKINLYLGLIKAKEEFKLDKVMLDCSADNIGSNKTIQSLGGVLERSEIDPTDNTLTNVYWINVDESLEKNRQKYSKYIKEKSKNDNR